MQTKSDVIIKLSNGDPNAFRDLFNMLYPRMLGYCALFVNNRSQAEDLVQDCFIKLWNKRKTLKTDGNVDKLLFVMLRNYCLNYIRDNKEIETLQTIGRQEVNDLQQLYNLDFLGEEESPLEEYMIHSLKEAIDNLPDRQKEVFQKAKVSGQSQKEVAAALGITVKAVEKNIALAKRRIREELARKYPTLLLIIFYILK